jgi:hypothetical protein
MQALRSYRSACIGPTRRVECRGRHIACRRKQIYSSTMTVHESWRTIEAALEKHARPIHAALRKPAGDSAIAKLAKLVPAKLPPDFAQSLKIHDGLNDSYLGQIRLFDYNALLPVSAIIEEYSMMCALQADSDFGGSQAGGDHPCATTNTGGRVGYRSPTPMETS